MLIRANPKNKTISLISFPRDLRAEIHCPGRSRFVTKINAAYAECGSRGTLDTVRNLTGVSVNYLITVNFRGFTQVVDKLGGIWMDIDRRYYNNNGLYSAVNLQPGYQRLNGYQALSFVRFRHTDSDLYRNARQQSFVRCLQGPGEQEPQAEEPAEGDQGAHEQHRGRAGWRQGRKRQDRALVRRPRVLAAAGSRLPVADRRARGLRRPDDVAGEHLRSDPRMGESRRRVAEEGHGRRARREGEDEDSGDQGDERHRPQRQRRHRLGVERELPARPARIPDPDAAERHSRQRRLLPVLPHEGLLRSEAEGLEGGGDARSRASSAPPTSRRRPLRSQRSRTTPC